MNGIVIIDKPAGITSHDAVTRVRRIFGERRVGHTGTLDPFATGVLVILIGRATRLAQFLSGAKKEYEAVIRFGYRTDTGDATGSALERSHNTSALGENAVRAALRELHGEIEQVPPMYSAKKIGGRKLYELARRGEEVERRAVRVTIHELEAIPREDGRLLWPNVEDRTCDLAVRVVCSAGTYIRVLAESVGERLGAHAHLASLRRIRAGAFHLERAVTLDQLRERLVAGTEDEVIISPAAALSEMPSAHLTGVEARRTRHGIALDVSDLTMDFADGQHIRMQDERGVLIAVGVYDAAKKLLRPRVCLAPEK